MAAVTKRCTTCGRFRVYDTADEYCIGCGHDGLESECECGRSYDYAMAELGDIHCPRCGRVLRGRSSDLEA